MTKNNANIQCIDYSIQDVNLLKNE
jgi:hypothetical protein